MSQTAVSTCFMNTRVKGTSLRVFLSVHLLLQNCTNILKHPRHNKSYGLAESEPGSCRGRWLWVRALKPPAMTRLTLVVTNRSLGHEEPQHGLDIAANS